MGDLLARFKDHLVTLGISDGSIRNYLSDLNHFQNWLSSSYPKQSFAEINSEHPLAYRTYLVHELEAPVSSVNRRLSSLRQFFTWAVTQNLIGSHPMQGLGNVSLSVSPPSKYPEPQNKEGVVVPAALTVTSEGSFSQSKKFHWALSLATIALIIGLGLLGGLTYLSNRQSGEFGQDLLAKFNLNNKANEIQDNKLLILEKSLQELSFQNVNLQNKVYQGSSLGDGSVIINSQAEIYPIVPGAGSIGVPANKFGSIYLSGGSLDKSGNLKINGTFSSSGLATFNSNVKILGSSETAFGSTILGLLTARGGITTEGASITAGPISAGSIAGATLTTTGNTSIGGSLTVTGSISGGAGSFTTLTSSGNTSLASGAGATFAFGNTTGTATLQSGGTSSWTNTGGNLTLLTATSGTLALTSAEALNLSAGAASTFTLANVANALNFDTDSLSIDALNNRVGIGTSAPSSKLEISAGATTANILQVSGSLSTNIAGAYFDFDSTAGEGNGLLIEGGGANAGRYSLRVRNAAASELFIVNADGKVGIGTTLPSSPLTVRGNSESRPIAWERYITGVQSGKTWAWEVDASATHLRNVTDVSIPITFLNGGNIGIGDLSPSTKLALGGTGASNGITFGDDAADFVNLYRSAANTLKTDDDLVIGATGNGKITVGVVDPYLIENTGTFQAALEFRTTATAGADDFVFTLGGTERARLTETGNLTIVGTLTAQSTSTSTFSGAIDMQNSLILNIGNAGTDFTSTGGLNLAGVLALGSGPAASGSIRLSNNGQIVSRNAANSADISLAFVDGSNNANLNSGSVINFLVGGTAVAHIGSSYLDIGTTPAVGVGVIRIPNNTQISFRNAANTADRVLIKTNTSDRITIGDDNSLIVANDGSFLSYGLTPATSGIIRLPNNSGISFRNAANTADIQALTLNSADNLQITSSSTLNISSVSGLATWTLQNVANAMNFDSNTLSIDALNNRVGIGTAAPEHLLSITQTVSDDQTVNVLTGSASRYGAITLGRTATELQMGIAAGNGQFATNTVAGDVIITNKGGGKLFLGTGNTASFATIDTSGNVGIGTASPAGKLEVENGNILLDRSNLKLTPELPPGAPTVAIGSATGITGTFNYQVTFVTASGETEGGTVSSNVTVSNQKVDLSAIPTGTTGFVTARKIYRSTTGPTTPRKLVTTINDNTTTIYTDNTADGSLGANISNINTTASIQVTNAENLYLVAGTGKAVVFGDGTGKITAGTFDPVYKIDGINYSTYAPSMLGVKEEITGSVTLIYDTANNNYFHTIDLANQPQGSDLWVFSRISDPDVNMTAVLVSANSSARVWYLKDAARRSITIFSDRGGEVSYRLTAPRFDHLSWGTLSEDQSTNGLTPPPAPSPVDSVAGSLSINSYLGVFSENFETTASVEAGEVVSADPNEPGKIKKSESAYDGKIIGVAVEGGDVASVISLGRVVVKVSVENGEILAGDHLTSSATKPGWAMKATQAGRTIGLALQPLTSSEGTILVSFNLSWFDPEAPVYNSNGTAASSTALSATYETLTATTAHTTNLNVGGVAIFTDESGNLKINGNVMVTGKGTFAEVRVNGLLTLMGGISAPNGLAVNLGLSKAFEVKNSADEVVASISDQGALIARSAEVAELKVSTSLAQPTTGVATFRAGGTSMLIETSKVISSSKIVVTFKGDYAPATRYWTSDEVSGESFTLYLDQAPSSDVSFNWWIVN